MSTTPSAAAATARQRLAGVLGTLQQDPNIPPNIVEIASGLAGAIGPLFKLERGDPDLNLFVQARGVLQGTLEKMQGVDQSFPGVADATQAIAETLRTIFNALKDAGALPGQPAAAPAPQPAPQPAPAAPVAPAFVAPQPVAPPQPAAPVAPYVAPAQPPQPVAPPAPVSAAPAPAAAPFSQPQPIAPAANPFAQPQPIAAQPVQPAQHAQHAPAAQPQRPASHLAMPAAPHAPSSASSHKHAAVSASVPLGPNGLPRLETEVNVHSESNFFTDFFGDIRNNGGVFVATFHVLPLGANCEVALAFPGNLSAEIQGKVKFTRNASDGASPGLGISIINASPDAWNLIERFVKKREPIMHDV